MVGTWLQLAEARRELSSDFKLGGTQLAHFASMHAEDAAEGREPMFTVHVSDMESDKPEGSDGQPATRFKRCQRVTIAPPMRADGADVLRGADAVVRTVLLQPGGAETLYEIGVLDLGSRIWGAENAV